MKLRIIGLLLLVFMTAGAAQQQATVTLALQITHAAILTWSASSTPGITQYNVYRGTISGGPYTKIASGNFLTYTDSNVTSGSTYFWVVTAVDSNNQESPYSNQVTGTIP